MMKKVVCSIVALILLIMTPVYAKENIELDRINDLYMGQSHNDMDLENLVNSENIVFDSNFDKDIFLNDNNSAVAIGLIELEDGQEQIRSFNNESLKSYAIAKASVTAGLWSGSFLHLNYDVYASSSVLMSSTCRVELYTTKGKFIKGFNMAASSSSATDHLSVTHSIGGLENYNKVKVVIKDAFALSNNGKTYPLPIRISSFIASR